MTAALLFALPALLLCALLLLGRYPGEHAIAHLARRRRRRCTAPAVPARRPAGNSAPPPRRRLAGALAGRAPPRRSQVPTLSTI